MGTLSKLIARGELRKSFPEETCPVCGKKFLRRCRRDEWGYWYNASDSQLSGLLVLLCSDQCSRKYAEMRLLRDVRRVAGTKCAQAIRLHDGGMLAEEAARVVGLSSGSGSLYAYETTNWKELEWLRAHDWKVPEVTPEELRAIG